MGLAVADWLPRDVLSLNWPMRSSSAQTARCVAAASKAKHVKIDWLHTEEVYEHLSGYPKFSTIRRAMISACWRVAFDLQTTYDELFRLPRA